MVERHRSIIESNFQHEKYLADLEEIILAIFNRDPFKPLGDHCQI